MVRSWSKGIARVLSRRSPPSKGPFLCRMLSCHCIYRFGCFLESLLYTCGCFGSDHRSASLCIDALVDKFADLREKNTEIGNHVHMKRLKKTCYSNGMIVAHYLFIYLLLTSLASTSLRFVRTYGGINIILAGEEKFGSASMDWIETRTEEKRSRLQVFLTEVMSPKETEVIYVPDRRGVIYQTNSRFQRTQADRRASKGAEGSRSMERRALPSGGSRHSKWIQGHRRHFGLSMN